MPSPDLREAPKTFMSLQPVEASLVERSLGRVIVVYKRQSQGKEFSPIPESKLQLMVFICARNFVPIALAVGIALLDIVLKFLSACIAERHTEAARQMLTACKVSLRLIFQQIFSWYFHSAL